jgi:two-component system NarL family sensor kinase
MRHGLAPGVDHAALSSSLWPRWLGASWFIGLLTFLTFAADHLTSSRVVVGYLYVVPLLLLLLQEQRPRRVVLGFCLFCCLLTMSTLLDDPAINLKLPYTTSRGLVCLALVVTTELGLRNLRLRTQQRLAQADLRQDLIATLAHDLKTPVLGCLASGRMILQELDPAAEGLQRRGLEAILASQNRCLCLIEDLLQVFRAELDGLRLQLAPFDLRGLASETLEALRPLALEREISLELVAPASPPLPALWLGDAALLRRLIENLLLNAIDHSLRRQTVELQIQGGAQEIRLLVLDRGSGFPPSALPHLFERFYRADPDRRGSGLGLYLCRQIVEAHRGTLRAANRPDGGASFLVHLPRLVPSLSSRISGSLAAPADRG